MRKSMNIRLIITPIVMDGRIVKRVLMRGDGLGDGAVKMLMAKLTDDLNFGII
jgi:hypothetical protein